MEISNRNEMMDTIINTLGIRGSMYFCMGNILNYKDTDQPKAEWYQRKLSELVKIEEHGIIYR